MRLLLQCSVLFVGFVVIFVQGGVSKTCKKCPNTTVTANLNDSGVVMELQRKYVRAAWNSTVVPTLSENATKLVEIMIAMANSDSYNFVQLAYQHALWSQALIPNIDDCNSYCVLARVINASVSWSSSQDFNASSQAVLGWRDVVYGNCYRFTQSILKQIGCNPLPDLPPQYPEHCWKKGFVYAINEVWELYGILMPCQLQTSVFALYESNDALDKLLAALAVMSMVPIESDMFGMQPMDMLIEIGNIGVYTNVSRCCCASVRNRLQDVCNSHVAAANRSAQILLDTKYGVENCSLYEI